MVVLSCSAATMSSAGAMLPALSSGSLCRGSCQAQKPLLAFPTNRHLLPSFSSIHVATKGFTSFSSITTAAIASDTSGVGSSNEAQTKNKYHFVVANAKFMLDEEEHFQEVMFERRRLFEERNMEQDFWLVIEPKFLDKFPNITKRLKRPAVALVSTNGDWIRFMKLRLDRVLSESFEANNLEEALASNPAKLEFEKPEKWVAPYPKYESGWWETFLPSN